jgi:hypothetical protein
LARLYAAGNNAVAVVEDGEVETALEGRGARCLAVNPEDPDTLYVGTSDEGLFKSQDGGGTWDRLSGVEYPRITAAAVSPADGALYAGTATRESPHAFDGQGGRDGRKSAARGSGIWVKKSNDEEVTGAIWSQQGRDGHAHRLTCRSGAVGVRRSREACRPRHASQATVPRGSEHRGLRPRPERSRHLPVGTSRTSGTAFL